MGITIQYSGKLRDPSVLPSFMHEVEDLCKTLGWKHEYISPDEDSPVEGVIIFIEGCDPVVLTFLPGGSLCHPFFYSYLKKFHKLDEIEAADQFTVTGTQEAGPDIHMQLIRIMRYWLEKYFGKYQLNDDSEFWETGDEEKCREAFIREGIELPLPLHDPKFLSMDFQVKTKLLKRKLRRRE